MRILVLSDSHRDKISLMMAVKLHREADVVVFLGDGEEDFQCEKTSSLLSLKEVHSVRGNCDVIRACRAKRRLLARKNRVYPFTVTQDGVKHGTEERFVRRKRKMRRHSFIRSHPYPEIGVCFTGTQCMCSMIA